MDGRTGGLTDRGRQTDRQTGIDKQRDRDRQTGRQAGRQTDVWLRTREPWVSLGSHQEGPLSAVSAVIIIIIMNF